MAARPTWKGFLKISLVNIPVRVFPATDSAATISFNQLHAECQTRIQQKRWCPHCEREVPMSEIAKGYEFEKGRYVVMSEDDMRKLIGDHGFTIANLSSRLTENGQQFEYRMTIKSRDRNNAQALSAHLRGLPEVLEFRIAPTGD